MSDLAFLLDQYASKPEQAYWLCPDDDGHDYCLTCAEEQINYFGHGTMVDGGYCRPHEGCCHCAKCGRLLDYTLTDYGAQMEIEHFSTVRFRKPLDREEAYHVARMIAAADDDKQAIGIAKRAIRAAGIPEGE